MPKYISKLTICTFYAISQHKMQLLILYNPNKMFMTATLKKKLSSTLSFIFVLQISYLCKMPGQPTLRLKHRDNYRPLAITCIWICNLTYSSRYNKVFDTTANQFGFWKDLSTECCVFSLKQVVEYYSPVYLCYLDANKSFHQINLWYLFTKILD